MIGRRNIVLRTALVAAAVAAVAITAVVSGGRTGAGARGDAPAGARGAFAPGPAALSQVRNGPIVQTVTPTLSPPLRDLEPAPVPALPFQEASEPDLPAPIQPASQPHDPAVQETPAIAAMPPPILTFEGLSSDDNPNTNFPNQTSGFVIPPDTEGDVGPNHYVEWINSSYAVYNKSGVRLPSYPKPGNSIFASLPGSPTCKTTNAGDPLVLYDQLADRWVLSQFTGSTAPYFQCIAVSKTPDPTGEYWLYPFPVSDTVFNDYGKLAMWPDGYYFSGAGFPATGFTPQAMAFERDKMLAGLPAQSVYFDGFNNTALAASAQQRMLPSDLDGTTLPPAGSPNFYVMHDDTNDRLELYRFHVDWTTPANSTFTLGAKLSVPAFDTAFTCNAATQTRQCIPQPGTTNRIDVLSTRLMYRFAYRNFGDHESLVVNQSVDANDPAPDHAGVRWYEIRDPNGTPVAHQASTYSPDVVDHRWMGSAAMDRNGDLAIGFSASGEATFPSIRYAGRLAGDALNQLTQGEATMFAGSLPQKATLFVPPSGPARWGDYSHLAVDPSDDCTFWYINEYYPLDPVASEVGIWHTRIGSFKFAQCSVVTAVSVRSFGARWRGRSVVVGWRTASEAEALGYNVYRSVDAGPFRKLNVGLIPAKRAGSAAGAGYRFVDRAVKRSGTYTYRLQLVSSGGKRSWHTIGAAAVR